MNTKYSTARVAFLATMATMFDRTAETLEALPNETRIPVSTLSDAIGNKRKATRRVTVEAKEDSGLGPVVKKGDKVPVYLADGKTPKTEEVEVTDPPFVTDEILRHLVAAETDLVVIDRGPTAGVWKGKVASETRAPNAAKVELADTKNKLAGVEAEKAALAAKDAENEARIAKLEAMIEALASKHEHEGKGKGKGKAARNEAAAE